MKMNGPGPKGLYIKKLADKMIKEKAGKRLIGPKAIDAKGGEIKEVFKESTWRPEAINEMRSDMRGPSTSASKSSIQKLLEDGLFVEKNGDFVPTEKYQKLKKVAGGLSKYGIK
jgi:hypothetical protein